MQQVPDAVLGPAAQLIAAVAVLISAVGFLVLKFVERRDKRTNGNSGIDINAIGIIVASNVRQEVGKITEEIREVKLAFTSVTAALQAVVITLTALTERIQHMPTDVDLATEHKDTRHDLRNALTTVQLSVQEHIDQRVDEVLRTTERRRTDRE